MKLHYTLGACSLGIHVLLEEIGKPYDLAKLDIKGGENTRPPFSTLNPKGKVPTLQRDDGSVEIHQQILVARPTQRAIVLGKGGAQIKEIGARARKELAEQLGKRVHLYLHVKVKADWDEDRGVYRDLGLDWVE